MSATFEIFQMIWGDWLRTKYFEYFILYHIPRCIKLIIKDTTNIYIAADIAIQWNCAQKYKMNEKSLQLCWQTDECAIF